MKKMFTVCFALLAMITVQNVEAQDQPSRVAAHDQALREEPKMVRDEPELPVEPTIKELLREDRSTLLRSAIADKAGDGTQPTPASDEEESLSGSCGEQATWSLDTLTHKLTISGQGTLTSAPWLDRYSDQIESVEIENGISSLPHNAFSNCIKLTHITIPNSIMSFDVDEYGDGYQFYSCSSLRSVIFEEGCQLTNIPSYTFYGCSALESIIIPKSVVSLGADNNGIGAQFYRCSSLTSVTFEEGCQLEEITSYAFAYCSALGSVIIPKSVKTFVEGKDGFGGQFYVCTSLQSVKFEEGCQLAEIPSYTFYYCSALESIVIPSCVKALSVDALNYGRQFYNCTSLAKVEFEEGCQLTEIPCQAFCYCSALESIVIPKSVKTFGLDNNGYGYGSQFCGCTSLASVKFEEGCQLTNIGSSAFMDCTSLRSIVIPKSVISFSGDSFDQGCQFYGCASLQSVKFEEGCQLTELPCFAFGFCTALETIVIPNTITTMGIRYSDGKGLQFYDCEALRYVEFEEGCQLTNIAPLAFSYCISLDEMTIPSSVVSLDEDYSGWGNQFQECTNLQHVYFGNGCQITSIPSAFLYGCSNLQDITIPSSVVTMGGDYDNWGEQFRKCYSLRSVIFEEGSQLTNISCSAFTDCYHLQSIIIPKSVTSFDQSTSEDPSEDGYGQQFCNCTSLRSVEFEEGCAIPSLPNAAFAGCESLPSIVLPPTITEFGANTYGQGWQFYGCYALHDIDMPSPTAPVLNGTDVFSNVSQTGNLTVPVGSDYSTWMEQLPAGWSVNYEMSEPLPCGENATWFFDLSMNRLIISGQGMMTSAPWLDLYKDQITSVAIENGITNLPYAAFAECSKLTSITIPNSITTFDVNASSQKGCQFEGCTSLIAVWFEEGCQLEVIPSNTFYGCKALSSITIPKSVRTFAAHKNGIGSQFSYCESLRSVEFEEGSQLEAIASKAFSNCWSLQSITIPKSVKEFGKDRFGQGAQFYDCPALENVIFEEGSQLTEIPAYTFNNCTSLQSITIPSSIKTLSAYQNGLGYHFYGCTSLQSITVLASTAPAIDGTDAFGNVAETGTLIVPTGSDYSTWMEQLPTGWTIKYGTDKTDPEPCGENATWSFDRSTHTLIISGQGTLMSSPWLGQYKDQIENVEIENGISNLPYAAFYECSKLTHITIPNSVVSFTDGHQFYNCVALQSVEFEEGCQLAEIPSYAFCYCSALESIVIPNSIKTFGVDPRGNGRQFYGCSTLKSVVFEEECQLTEIPAYAFYGCSALESIIIPKSVVSFGVENHNMGGQFMYCEALQSVQFEEGCQPTELPCFIFGGCSSLESIIIPSSIATLGCRTTDNGGYQFYDCTSLQSITILAPTAPVINGTDVFSNIAAEGILNVSAGSDYSMWMELLPAGWTMKEVNVYTPCDVDDDGEITEADAEGIMSLILQTDTEGLVEEAADINGDGRVTITDAVAVVNMMLQQDVTKAAARRMEDDEATATLAIAPMSVKAGSSFDMPIVLNGTAGDVTALQARLVLPEGITLAGITTDEQHSLRYAEQEDGSYEVAALSFSNALFAGNGDAVLILHLEADATFTEGDIAVGEAELATPTLQMFHPEAVSALLTKEEETAIHGLTTDSADATAYDLLGRKVQHPTSGLLIRNGNKQYYR